VAQVKVQAAFNYAAAFPEEINGAIAENETTDFEALKHMLLRRPNSFPSEPEGKEMLKLLLDEHISPRVANGLRRRNRAIRIRYMVEWDDGRFLGQDDHACLREAAAQGLTLVTYDRKTIPPCSRPGLKKADPRRCDLCG